MRTLINEAIKNGADPASLAAALTTPGVANNMAGMALVEASAQKEYGTSFGALGLEDQKILLGMVGKVYVEGVQSIGLDGQPLAAIGNVEKLPTVEVVGKSSGGCCTLASLSAESSRVVVAALRRQATGWVKTRHWRLLTSRWQLLAARSRPLRVLCLKTLRQESSCRTRNNSIWLIRLETLLGLMA